MPEDDTVVVVLLKDVEFQYADEVMMTTDVRVVLNVDEHGGLGRQLEFKYQHECGADNWLVMGTDPGEYRCIGCVDWL